MDTINELALAFSRIAKATDIVEVTSYRAVIYGATDPAEVVKAVRQEVRARFPVHVVDDRNVPVTVVIHEIGKRVTVELEVIPGLKVGSTYTKED